MAKWNTGRSNNHKKSTGKCNLRTHASNSWKFATSHDIRTHPPEGLEQAIDVIDTCLANKAYATRTAIHHTLNISPGALIFQRDMILNIPLIADLERLQQKRQALIDEQL